MNERAGQDDEYPEEIELLQRRLQDRQRELAKLERDLDRVESWIEGGSAADEEAGDADREVARLQQLAEHELKRHGGMTMSSESSEPGPSSRLEPQFKAALGGVDREALRHLTDRAENLELRLEHLRVFAENAERRQAAVASALLETCQRLEERDFEEREGRRRSRIDRQRAVAVLSVVGLVLMLWYCLSLGMIA